MNQDIVIRLTGSTAATMERKATALERLAISIATINRVAGRGAAFTGATRGANQYARAIEGASARTDRFGTVIRGGGNALDNFGTLFSRMVRIMTAYFIISQATRLTREFISSIVEAPSRMELWNTQLIALTGNATVAAERLSLLKDVAIATPLELPDLFQGLVTLQAFNVEISDRTLPLIADLAAVANRSFEDVAAVIGKVIQGSQPAITRSLPTLGINPAEFRQLEQELGNRADAIFQIIEQRFGGFALQSSRTVIGIVSNIKDAFFVIQATVGEGVLPLIRRRVTQVFDALNNLRNNDEALENLRVRLFAIAEGLERGAVSAFEFGQRVNDVAQALGGLQVLLASIGGILLVRMIVNIVRAVAVMNPWLVALVAAGGLALALAERFGFLDKELDDSAASQRLFADELARTNGLIAENIGLVDAAQANAQANRLTGFIGQGDLILSRLGQGDITGAGQFARGIVPILEAAGQEGAQALVQEVESGIAAAAIGSGRIAEVGLESARQGVLGLMLLLSNAASELDAAAAEAERQAGLVRGTPPATGGGSTELTQSEIFRRREAFLQSIEEFNRDLVRSQAEFISGPVDIARAQLAAGQLSREGLIAVVDEQIRGAREILQQNLDSETILGVTSAIAVSAEISNLEGLKAQLEKALADPITEAVENTLRQSFQRAGDVIGTALGEALAGVEGTSVVDALKLSFAAILNLFGDMLIQMGAAKEVFDSLVNSIVSLIPGGGAAAIAAGIALKAAASALSSSVGGSRVSTAIGSAASSPGSFSAPGAPAASFQSFQAGQFGGAGTTILQVQAVDAASVQALFEANPEAVAAGVKRVVRGDVETRGQEFGVFTPGAFRKVVNG